MRRDSNPQHFFPSSSSLSTRSGWRPYYSASLLQTTGKYKRKCSLLTPLHLLMQFFLELNSLQPLSPFSPSQVQKTGQMRWGPWQWWQPMQHWRSNWSWLHLWHWPNLNSGWQQWSCITVKECKWCRPTGFGNEKFCTEAWSFSHEHFCWVR